MPGKGRVLVSGSTVLGEGSEFLMEARPGWLITVRNPASLVKCSARISVIASQTSLALSEPLGFNLSTHSDYWLQETAK
jgi:hypothetical protein